MDNFSLALSFLFGLVMGSFLNVVSIRLHTGKSLNGRSHCMSCGKTLTWKELIPLFSFLFQRGKCSKCESKVSWQYPVVEFISGLLFLFIFIKFPPFNFSQGITSAIYLLSTCLLIVITVYDAKHKIIPDLLVFSFDALAIINLFVGGKYLFHVSTFEALIAGPLLAVPFALLSLVSGGRWMGWGDSKLVLGIGWFLGINAGINAIILAFWIGAGVSILWLYYTHKKFKPKMEIPFGPYLILAMYIVMLSNIQVIDVAMLRSFFGIL